MTLLKQAPDRAQLPVTLVLALKNILSLQRVVEFLNENNAAVDFWYCIVVLVSKMV